jgi:hypothetical protein
MHDKLNDEHTAVIAQHGHQIAINGVKYLDIASLLFAGIRIDGVFTSMDRQRLTHDDRFHARAKQP